MPSQINLQITGRIRNIVFYKRGDKYYARSVSGGIKQTKATKKRATEFGKASRAGKILRQQLLPVIPFPADNTDSLIVGTYPYATSMYDTFVTDYNGVNEYVYAPSDSITVNIRSYNKSHISGDFSGMLTPLITPGNVNNVFGPPSSVPITNGSLKDVPVLY